MITEKTRTINKGDMNKRNKRKEGENKGITNQDKRKGETNKVDSTKVAGIRKNETKKEGECGKEEHRSNLRRNQTKYYINLKIIASSQQS